MAVAVRAPRLSAAEMARKLADALTPNRFQQSFHAFLTELVWSRDEARAGLVRKFPNYPYLKDLCDALIERDLLLIEKSRRVLASWVVCAFDIWLCAGGQDPRWVNSEGQRVLLLSTRNRKVLLAALKQEGEQSSEWFLQERVKAILEESEARGLREAWPQFPTWTAKSDRITFHETNCYIAAVPEGQDKLRGAGSTFIHAEEVAFWPHAKPSITAALPVLQGGGHLCGVTTAQVSSFAAEIVKGKEEGEVVYRPGQVLPLTRTKTGWHVLTIHYSAVPHYDFKDASRGFTSDEDIRRELEIDWTASSGKRVYSQFDRRFHVAIEPLPFDPKQTLYCGLDMPGTPAFVPTQLNAYGQWLIYPSLSPSEDETIGVYEFGEMMADLLQREYAMPYGLDLEDLKVVIIGDPAGAAAPPRTGQSPKEQRACWDILRRGEELEIGTDEHGRRITERKPGWGWRIVPGAVDLATREAAVRARLATILADGHAALVVDPRATVVQEAFLGGHHYKQRADGRYELDAFKGYHSHTANACEYACTRLFAKPKRDPVRDPNEPRKEPFRSHASSSGRRG